MRIIPFIATCLSGALALADSGGPYEAVPDVRKDEQPPIFSIPVSKEHLRYFLRHMPKLNLNPRLNEPDSYTWTEVGGYHACFRVLGHVRGREVYEVRYVSDGRIDEGLDYADAILILARGFDTGPDKAQFEPLYYSTGGTSYDRRAEYLPDGDKYGAMKVTDWWSGTGPGRWRSVYLRGTEDFKFERFTPDKSKAEQDGGDFLAVTELRAEELWSDDRITPNQPFRAKVVGVQPGWGWDAIILKEIEGDGRYCLATFGNPLGDYQIIRKEDFDAKAMKQKGTTFIDPAIEVGRFSWSTGIWRHGRIFGDEDAATKHRKNNGEQAGTGQPATRPKSDAKGGDKPQPEAEGRSR